MTGLVSVVICPAMGTRARHTQWWLMEHQFTEVVPPSERVPFDWLVLGMVRERVRSYAERGVGFGRIVKAIRERNHRCRRLRRRCLWRDRRHRLELGLPKLSLVARALFVTKSSFAAS